MKRWMLTGFAVLSLVLVFASPATAAPGGNAAAAKQCQKGSYLSLARSDSPTVAFTSQDACVSYAAGGGRITARTTPSTARVVISVTGPSNGLFCPGSISLVDAAPGTTVYLTATFINSTETGGVLIEAGMEYPFSLSQGDAITGATARVVDDNLNLTGAVLPVEFPTAACLPS